MPAPDHRLYVLRHAKSSWDDPRLADHDRPLAPRGRRAAKALRRHLSEERIRPTIVLCSSARRAVETYERVAPAGELVVEEALYAASTAAVIERLRALPERIASAMVIAHNPALQEMIVSVASSEPPSGPLDAVREKFPTCALATLVLRGPWRDFGRGRVRLAELVRPADLR